MLLKMIKIDEDACGDDDVDNDDDDNYDDDNDDDNENDASRHSLPPPAPIPQRLWRPLPQLQSQLAGSLNIGNAEPRAGKSGGLQV